MRNKKGIAAEEVVFILLNLFFFVVMLIFVRQSGTGKMIIEERYAKEIALMIDGAKPSTTIFLDMGDAVEIARENNWDKENIVSIDEDRSRVVVRLGSSGGYFYHYYTKAKVSAEMQQMYLVVRVEKNV